MKYIGSIVIDLADTGDEWNAEDLKEILENLGNRVRQIIWGEHVWKKGEVIGTKAMTEAYLAGKGIGK